MTNPFDSPHYKAMSMLKPIPMDAEDYAVAKELDRALVDADKAHEESFVSGCTADGMLSRWEDAYGLPGEGTEEERKQALIAAVNRQWGIAAKHYMFIAEQMGFSVEIGKPVRLFRAGLSRVGEKVYPEEEQYTWSVKVLELRENCSPLINEFESQKIPFTEIRWSFND